MNPEIVSALIGAAVGVAACVFNNLLTVREIKTQQMEHVRRFEGVDALFAGLDMRFVPRNEIDARLKELSHSQERIEKLLNLVLPYAIRSQGVKSE